MHLGIGARFIAPQTVVEAFFHFDPRNFDHNVIIKLRLLRLCAAMVTGASLGVAGVLLQSVIRNPLGEPHILGLNAGAALAVVITSALGLSLPFGRPLVAAAGAAALFLLVLMFSSSGRTGLTPMKVTLCGVAMSAFASGPGRGQHTDAPERPVGYNSRFCSCDRAVALAQHAGAGRPNGAGAWRVAAENPPARPAGDCAALRRGRFHCRADWLYRPSRAAAHSSSGVGRFTRDGAAVCPVWRAGSAAGGYRRPHVVYAVGAGNRHHDGPGRRARIHLYGVEDVQMNRAGFRAIRIGRLSALVRPRALACLTLLSLVALSLLGFGLTHGSLPIPTSAIGLALFSPESLTAETRYIVMDIRLPRLLMAVLCGAMLGMAGAAMQSITRNGLADPGLIGVKEGCSAAVLLLIFQFPALGLAWRPLVGMAGGLLTALLVIALARDISRPRFILIGIGVSWAFSAAMGVFITTADVRDVQTAMLWLAGSLHAANWTLVGLAALWAAPAFALLLFTARAADVALLGNQAAVGLGVRITRLALLRVLAPVVLTAACVSCVGSIGFVGLIAPHMARLLLRGGQTALLTGSAVLGALLVLLADNVGRLAFLPLQLPAGIVISLIGGPFFLLLLWQRRDRF
ncbi:hypothetical protein L1887_44169 [Cichorium endivia]|nr:hypothetical protein L1887_44169 [Cichorium endivia]